MPTEDAYSLRTPGPIPFEICICSSNRNHTTYLWRLPIMTFTEIYLTDLERFQENICNGCGMPTGDADSSGHLVLSHFGTWMCSNVETNLSWTCLVSGPLNFEHPSVLLFCSEGTSWSDVIITKLLVVLPPTFIMSKRQLICQTVGLIFILPVTIIWYGLDCNTVSTAPRNICKTIQLNIIRLLSRSCKLKSENMSGNH